MAAGAAGAEPRPEQEWEQLRCGDQDLGVFDPAELAAVRDLSLAAGRLRVCLVGHESIFWKASGFGGGMRATQSLVSELSGAEDLEVDVVAVTGGKPAAGKWLGLRAYRLSADDAVANVARRLGAFDVVICATEEREMVAFARRVVRSRRVGVLIHNYYGLPFGPESYVVPLARKPGSLVLLQKHSDATWPRGWEPPPVSLLCASEALARYCRLWGGSCCRAEASYAADYGYFDRAVGPQPDREGGADVELPVFERPYVTAISPCAPKGLCILAAVARAMPHVRFMAVATGWTDIAAQGVLNGLANVEVVKAQQDVRRIYAESRAVLIPSLWSEAFALVAIEAQLQGIPVVSTDKGGLPESNLGPPELLVPVQDELHLDHARCLWREGRGARLYSLSNTMKREDMEALPSATPDCACLLETERQRTEDPLPASRIERAERLLAVTLSPELDARKEGTVAASFAAALSRLLTDQEFHAAASAAAQARARDFVEARRGRLLRWIRETAAHDEVCAAPPALGFEEGTSLFASKDQYEEAAAMMRAQQAASGAGR